MQKIATLYLPSNLPSPEALESQNENENTYDPEFWEFFYDIYPYLKNSSDEYIIQRYKDICRNYRILVRDGRDIIPIKSFLSSWYWCIKEHQTRYELHNRKIELPNDMPTIRGSYVAPAKPKFPNFADVLFKYGNYEHMKRFIDYGELKISPASFYKNGEKDNPRTDDELQISRFILGDRTKITNKAGKELKISGDLCHTKKFHTDYYVYCMSTEFDPLLLYEFGYDSCVVIHNTDLFIERLFSATNQVFKSHFFHHNPIEYIDPMCTPNNYMFKPAICKDFRFAYQMEYRFIWSPHKFQDQLTEHLFVRLGSLADICNLYQ